MYDIIQNVFFRVKCVFYPTKNNRAEPKIDLQNDLANLIEAEEIKFNLDILKEFLRQAELKIQHEDERKVRIDTRASQMLGAVIGFITYIASQFFDLQVKSTEIKIVFVITFFFFVYTIPTTFVLPISIDSLYFCLSCICN